MGETIIAEVYQDEERWTIDVPLRGGALGVLLVVPAPEAPAPMDRFVAELSADALGSMRRRCTALGLTGGMAVLGGTLPARFNRCGDER